MIAPASLAQELREIAEGRLRLPKSAARRHHYVPAFLLARFASPPGDRRAWTFQLDTATGKPQKTTPDSACFEPHLYAQTIENTRDNAIESLFSVIEKHAAPALDRLSASPLTLAVEDRETLSYFLAFQFSRTPVALEQTKAMAETMTAALFGVHLSDPVEFDAVYREAVDPAASVGEVEKARAYLRLALEGGRIRTEDPKLQALHLMLSTADDVAKVVYGLSWTVIEATEDEFVTSDRGLAMHDPTPRFPWSGHAWISSPNAETTIPLGPRHCLLCTPGPTRVGHAEVGRKRVLDINLRTYGWAQRFIYGSCQEVVAGVRRAARQRPADVVRPLPSRQILVEEADPNDPDVGCDNAKRGWPRGLWQRAEDGGRQFVSYTVLDHDDPRSAMAALSGRSIGERVIERATAEGKRRSDIALPDDD